METLSSATAFYCMLFCVHAIQATLTDGSIYNFNLLQCTEATPCLLQIEQPV